ncbi:L-threonine ammonia-lyase-like [Helicoverpa zea]|uniref:L-threonine ammonia-lyase-like n=1 Tax=Helicoverpa zea TaxID=7113 RepID=UPI001F5AD8C0|nr:L-threonine ammonia-lyase-like [Helicoverpa zea]
MPKQPVPAPPPPVCRESLGLSPAVLAKRDIIKQSLWCPNPSNIEYDRYSDPACPKTIHYRHVVKADEVIREIINTTPLMKSKTCEKFGMELYFKLETVHFTGTFHERAAIYALLMLTPEQKRGGVYTASVGNWAQSLAHQGQLLDIAVTVVLPSWTANSIVAHCQEYGATVVLCGKTILEAKKRAFKMIHDQGRIGTYINGYDHPNVIAGAGSIGIEILEQLPDTDAILIPIGGGGLIAGVATFVKHVKPNILIYGVETGKSCSFAKAIDYKSPYLIEPERGLAESLTVPKAGENAFHTARSLIDKLILVHDDWTARAILHLMEEEKVIAEGAGAISLGALMSMPDILPELKGKKVVCIVSGGNMDIWPLQRAIAHGKAVEGRCIAITMRLMPGMENLRNKILRVIQNMKCNVKFCETQKNWLDEDKILDTDVR